MAVLLSVVYYLTLRFLMPNEEATGEQDRPTEQERPEDEWSRIEV